MLEYDDFIASVFVKKTTGTKKISAKEWKTFQSGGKKDVEGALLRSYNAYLDKSGSKWLNEGVDGTAESVLQIRKPLDLQADGSLKVTFEIRGAVNGCCGDSWAPFILLREYMEEPDAKPEWEEYGEEWVESKLKYDAVRAVE